MPIISGGAGSSSGGIGSASLIYRYTVSGSVKASIDTGVDTPNVGSNNWANGDLLEILLVGRTDEAVAASLIDITVNNDSGANYDRQYLDGSAAVASAGNQFAASNIQPGFLAGASAPAGTSGHLTILIPDYAGTTFNKSIQSYGGNVTSTTSGTHTNSQTFSWRSTAAITRVKVIPDTAAKNFAVGTQLLVYKRIAS